MKFVIEFVILADNVARGKYQLILIGIYQLIRLKVYMLLD